jgi:copper chaperone CopZ
MNTTTTTYRVTGMSCGHCVAAVTTELTKLGGVASVEVALESGEVTVTSAAPLADADVAAAIDEAGFELAS